MKKVYVLDTSVLLHDEYSWRNFKDNEVYVPMCVLEELEKIKEEKSERGRKSREFARVMLGLIRGSSDGSGLDKVEEGVRIGINEEGGGLILGNKKIGEGDKGILNVGQYLVETYGKKVILVTKDKYLEVKAVLGALRCEPYKTDRVEWEYTGVQNIHCNGEIIDEVYRGEVINFNRVYVEEKGSGPSGVKKGVMSPNMGVRLIDDMNPKKTALGVYRSLGDNKGTIDLLKTKDVRPSNIKAVNVEQTYALGLLMDPNVHLVTITGATGSGKTLLSLAAALQLIDDEIYSKLIITRAEISIGKDRGFLPGNDKEKAEPWLEGIHACLQDIINTNGRSREGYEFNSYNYYESQGIIQAKSLAYIRGMTWKNTFVLIDEAQNLTVKEIKALITRAGNGDPATKVVLLGDTDQIDHPYLDKYSNGLTQVIDRFQGWEHYGHIKLNKTVRSKLADEAGLRL